MFMAKKKKISNLNSSGLNIAHIFPVGVMMNASKEVNMSNPASIGMDAV